VKLNAAKGNERISWNPLAPKSHTNVGAKGKKRVYPMEERRVPVLMRGTYQGIPMATPRRATKSQRRMEIPLSIPGAEVRLPALPSFGFGWRLVSGALSLSLLLLLYLVWTAPLFRVQNVEISGLNRITEKEVNLELNLEDELIFAIDPQELQERIQKQFPEFSYVRLTLKLPNKVHFSVQERVPMLVWKQEGRTLLIDADGYAFPVRGQAVNLPKLVIQATSAPTGAAVENFDGQPASFLPADMVSGVLSLSALLPEGATIVYDQEHGLGWKDKRGWDVYFGKIENIGLKMKIYDLLVKKLKKEDIKPILISVEYVHAPYYRLER
jgi:cell division septal protein FtsQ